MLNLYGKVILIVLLTLSLYSLALAENAQQYNNEGVSYLQAGDYKRARECFENAHNLALDNEIIKNNLVNSYIGLAGQQAQENNWIEAINFGEKAYLLDRTNTNLVKSLAVFYNNYGYEQMKEGSFDKAYLNFNKALKFDDNNWSVYANLGNLTYEQGKIEETINSWQKAVALNPDLLAIKNKLSELEKENKIGENFKRQEFSHFQVKYEGYCRQELATKVLVILEEAYYRLGADFNYYPKEKITVTVYTQGQFKDVTGNPEWLSGEAEGGGIIRVTADDIEKDEQRLKNVLYHEYVHILLYRKVGRNVARWLNEGLAQYKEPAGGDKLSQSELVLLRRYLSSNALIYMADLDTTWLSAGNRETIDLAYLEAKLYILYLVDKYSFYQVLRILDKLKEGQDIYRVLKDTFYADLPEFEQRWRHWLKEKYGK